MPDGPPIPPRDAPDELGSPAAGPVVPLQLSPEAASAIRDEVARAGGREVSFIARVSPEREVISPRAVARGNMEAVLAAAKGCLPLRVRLDFGAMVVLLGGMCVYVILFVAGFLAMGGAVMKLPPAAAPTMIGAVSLATGIGFVVLFAPGGVGVREGLLLVFLSPLLGRPAAAVLAVCLRLLQIVVDVCLAGIGLIVLRRLQRDMPVPAG